MTSVMDQPQLAHGGRWRGGGMSACTDRPGRIRSAAGAVRPGRVPSRVGPSYGSETLVPSPLLLMVNVPEVVEA